jgi:3-hydroxybutyrate dehydrogenase
VVTASLLPTPFVLGVADGSERSLAPQRPPRASRREAGAGTSGPRRLPGRRHPRYQLDMELTKRRALITGGGRGIGKAIAQALAAAGAEILVTGRSADELAEVAAATSGRALRADLADRADADRLHAELLADIAERGPIQILVNNAGISDSASLEKTGDAVWDRIMEVNVTAPFRLTRALLPAMVKSGWGRIINIASNAGLTGYGYTAAYCASKHALVGFTRSLALDVARSGVTVNALCPGWVETDMVAQATSRISQKTGRSAEEATAALAAMSPQRRIIEPAEVAHAALSLCAEAARGIHGQTIVIDGGQVMK